MRPPRSQYERGSGCNGKSHDGDLSRDGSAASFDTVPPVSFTVGNPSSVRVRIDDRPHCVPVSDGVVRTVRSVEGEQPSGVGRFAVAVTCDDHSMSWESLVQ